MPKSEFVVFRVRIVLTRETVERAKHLGYKHSDIREILENGGCGELADLIHAREIDEGHMQHDKEHDDEEGR